MVHQNNCLYDSAVHGYFPCSFTDHSSKQMLPGQANKPLLKSALKTGVSQKKLTVEPMMRYDIPHLFIRLHLQKKWEIICCYQHQLSNDCTVGA